MFISSRKELFSIAYVKSISAPLGFNSSTLEVDDDSVDLQLAARNFGEGAIRNPQIQLQLKCTELIPNEEGVLKFPLSVKNYNDLRGTNVLCPRYLIVVTVPATPEEWIEHGDDQLVLKKNCYWYSLRDEPETENQTTVTIDIPTSNRLTSESLKEIMVRACNSESL